jgi:hypothetical protein
MRKGKTKGASRTSSKSKTASSDSQPELVNPEQVEEHTLHFAKSALLHTSPAWYLYSIYRSVTGAQI